ncbi:unnamed protein product [Rotaria sp. Silwood1]|nr:unnamed protein product [Rotaria sp. Silwood1]
MLDDERFLNNKHHLFDSQSLQTIQRKISKQKTAAERRIEQSNGNQMFESFRPNHTYSSSSTIQNHYYSPQQQQHSSFLSPSQSYSSEHDNILRHSTNSRMLHNDHDVILTNDFEYQQFHQPNTRKITKIIPKENNSLTNNRSIQPRSLSASTIKRENKDSSLTSNDIQRLKNVRRHEPAHVQSDSKTGLIGPDSWKTDPVIIKRPPAKKSTIENVSKPIKTDGISQPIVEQSTIEHKQQTEKKPKPKRDTTDI